MEIISTDARLMIMPRLLLMRDLLLQLNVLVFSVLMVRTMGHFVSWVAQITMRAIFIFANGKTFNFMCHSTTLCQNPLHMI